jgi:hypothetical protein
MIRNFAEGQKFAMKIVVPFVLFITAIYFSAYPQDLSDKALKPYVDLWRNENVDSLQSLLPALSAKFPNKPEILFFQAVFETNGEHAAKIYEALLVKYPNNIFADECQYRLIQSDYAAAAYQNIPVRLELLKKNYPQSKFIKRAEECFSYSDSGSAKVQGNVTIQVKNESNSKALLKKFRLQVGAFSQLKNAEDLKETLSKQGYADIELSEKTVNDKKLILVWMGAFDSREEAKKAGEGLKTKLQISYTVVEN